NSNGLDFTSGAPVPLNNTGMDAYEGCANWCDALGNLQLSTNGGGSPPDNPVNGPRNGYLWDAGYNSIFDYGDDKGGHYSSAQGAVIHPAPGNPQLLYVFTVDAESSNRGLHYSVVDMSLNGGLGDIILADAPIFSPASEALTLVPHSNGIDFWIITLNNVDGNFVAVPVTAAGIGTPKQTPTDLGIATAVVKASPDGKFLCENGNIYNFDASTGSITYKVSVGLDFYCFSFSPLSRYLYGHSGFEVTRYDLYNDDIPKSVDTLPLPNLFSLPGHMQIGPDGNLYFIEQLEEDLLMPIVTVSLGTIKCPDGAAWSLEESITKFEADPLNAFFGWYTSLPNYPPYIFGKSIAAPDTMEVNLCGGTQVLTPNPTGTFYAWSTGDSIPQLTVTTPGFYEVLVQDDCGLFRQAFRVKNVPNTLLLAPESPIVDTCHAFPFVLRATTGSQGTYLWSDGSTNNAITVNTYGTYSVTFTDECGAQSATYTLNAPTTNVSIAPISPVTDTCHVFPLPLRATGDGPGSYLWSTGDATPEIIINTFGTYSVTFTGSCGQATAAYTLNAPSPNTLEVLPDLPVADTCAAFPLTIRAISNRMVDYLWSDGSTDETLIINDFGLYSVTISNDCGDVSGQYELLRPNLEVSIKPKDAVADECSAVPLTLKATANQNVVFKWKNNSTMDTLRVTEPGTYAVTVTAGVCGTATASYEVLGPGPECCRPLFPNAFTPNGDQNNDTFAPILLNCVVEYAELFVYSRWGELMYQGFEKNDKWDGLTLNGTDAQSDVYVYVYRYKLADANEVETKGEVTLLR
ncbi:MAG: gliding motility-associated C-terminal domain-containing protein, partial [Saprospiraceae bacterium]|nr:gliding motility-associated C-terminal domain-containing protein [Saprospiraceae bacterium]